MNISKFEKILIDSFIKMIDEKSESINKDWFNKKRHTENITNILEKIGENNDFNVVKNGFWTLDCIYFKESIDEALFGTWPLKLNVIIEHENEGGGAWQEVAKLCYWKADIKILITYFSEKARTNTKDNLLKFWSEIINKLKSNNENFLLILGNDNKKEFEVYKFMNDKFIVFST
jgi:hypothetical protein